MFDAIIGVATGRTVKACVAAKHPGRGGSCALRGIRFEGRFRRRHRLFRQCSFYPFRVHLRRAHRAENFDGDVPGVRRDVEIATALISGNAATPEFTVEFVFHQDIALVINRPVGIIPDCVCIGMRHGEQNVALAFEHDARRSDPPAGHLAGLDMGEKSHLLRAGTDFKLAHYHLHIADLPQGR